jgi:hypothetical protein
LYFCRHSFVALAVRGLALSCNKMTPRESLPGRFDLSDFLSFNKVSQYLFHSSMNFTPSYTSRCQKTHNTTAVLLWMPLPRPFQKWYDWTGWCSDIDLFSLPTRQVTASGKKNMHESLGYTRLSISDPSALFYIQYFLCNIHWLVIYWLPLIECKAKCTLYKLLRAWLWNSDKF